MGIIIEVTASKIQFSAANQPPNVLSGDVVSEEFGDVFIAAGSEEFEGDYTLTVWSQDGTIFLEDVNYALIDDEERLVATYEAVNGCIVLQDGIASLKIQLNRNSEVAAGTYTLARLQFGE